MVLRSFLFFKKDYTFLNKYVKIKLYFKNTF